METSVACQHLKWKICLKKLTFVDILLASDVQTDLPYCKAKFLVHPFNIKYSEKLNISKRRNQLFLIKTQEKKKSRDIVPLIYIYGHGNRPYTSVKLSIPKLHSYMDVQICAKLCIVQYVTTLIKKKLKFPQL
jgi:hypothetical protein